jgi:hypothetical protein
VRFVTRSKWHFLKTGTGLRLLVHGERELSGINSNENEEPELQTKLETKSNCCYSAEHEGIGRMQEKWKIRYAKRKKKTQNPTLTQKRHCAPLPGIRK